MWPSLHMAGSSLLSCMRMSREAGVFTPTSNSRWVSQAFRSHPLSDGPALSALRPSRVKRRRSVEPQIEGRRRAVPCLLSVTLLRPAWTKDGGWDPVPWTSISLLRTVRAWAESYAL